MKNFSIFLHGWHLWSDPWSDNHGRRERRRPDDRRLGRAIERLAIVAMIRKSDTLRVGGAVMSSTTSRVGKRGTIVVPAALRKRYGLDEGALVIAEERDEGILLRPAIAFPVEIYTPERRAELLLNNAVDSDDYQGAAAEVRSLGLDPDTIPHQPPGE
jgi:AbrB family looped-hinge helix DNA binding protein